MNKKVKITLRVLIPIVLVVSGIFYASIRINAPILQKQTRFLMDTYCTIQCFGPKHLTKKAINAALDRIEEIDRKFNFLDSASPLYAFNHQNESIRDSEIISLIKVAQDVSEQSKGAFDITIQPLVELWGFYGDSPALPAKEKIEDCLNNLGYKYLMVTEDEIKNLKPGIRIDLGGIAKGYSLGEAAKVLRSFGIDSALIDAGGDVYTMGKIKGKNWKIGIRNPRGEGVIGIVQTSDLTVVTSGDYERYFFEDSARYCHIIDSRTGYPAQDLISATVISQDPTLADAWATALFVLGTDGMKIIEESPNLEAMIVTAEMQVLCSKGLLDNLDLAEPNVK